MIEVNSEQLEQYKQEGKKLLVEFFATWCRPCAALMPRLEKIENEYPDITFVKIDIDKNRDIVQELGIMAVPSVIFFNGKEYTNGLRGSYPDDVYKRELDTL